MICDLFLVLDYSKKIKSHGFIQFCRIEMENPINYLEIVNIEQ